MLGACTSSLMPQKVDGVVGATDERVVKSGEKMIQRGGNAADAMAAMLMSASVVMPARTGLGAGGVCQILDPSDGRVKTLDFLSKPMTFDGKIGTPSLARGVFALQNKYGRKRWGDVFTDALTYADKGAVVSDALAKDIVHTQGLPAAWKKLKRKDILKQPELAKTLRILSSYGAGVLYSGDLAKSLVAQSSQIVQEDLKNFKASFMDSIDVSEGGRKTFFANPSVLSADGYTIWKGLQDSSKTEKVASAAQSLQTLDDRLIDVESSVSGTALMAADKSGLVVVCSVSMGSAFGTRELTDEGFYLGNAIGRDSQGAVFLNILQTNPDVTDVSYTIAGVGDYALADGLHLLAASQKDLPDTSVSDNRQNVRDDFILWTCEKGYPNSPSSCKGDAFVHEVLPKQDLTN